MGRVSRKSIDSELQKELEEQLATMIASLFDKKETALFLNEFLTREEKIMLGKRLVLYMLLEKGTAIEDIRKALGVTLDTVKLYKLQLDVKPEAFHKSIKRLLNRERAKELWNKIDKAMRPLDLFLRSKHDMKARAKFASGDWLEE